MKLCEVISEYPTIRLALPKDSDNIIEFLRSIPMKFGGMSLRYDFEDHLWKFLHYQGTEAHVFLIAEEDKLRGYGVISIREYYVLGKRAKAGYLSDLRISPKTTPKAKHEWKECVNSIFSNYKKIDEFRNIDYFYAAVFEKNTKALKLFQSEHFPLIFNSLIAYQGVSILGRKLLKLHKLQKSNPNYKFQYATQNDENSLRKFLNIQNIKKFWGEYFNADAHDEWERRKESWTNFKIEDFIILKDKDGNIIFSTLPWAPKKTRKLIVEKINIFYIILGKFFKLIGKKELRINSPLNNYYLTHLEFAHTVNQKTKKEIFSNFLIHLHKTDFQREYHSVIFCDYYDKAINEVLNDYMVIKTPARLYQILPQKDQKNMLEITSNMLPEMAFETAII